MKRLEALDPSIIEERAKIEKFIQNTQQRIVPLKDVVIPVVFHIITYKGREAITEDRVFSQLEALNRDFNNPTLTLEHLAIDKASFRERVDQMTIQFCFPELKGNNNSSPINFYTTEHETWSMDDAMKYSKSGGIAPWNTSKFLNIWVVDLEHNMAGYAQLPGGPEDSDGIVIDRDFFGISDLESLYSGNKTLTHLVGNYLGLHSLWGEEPCADDYVTDTPIHNAPNFGCPIYRHYSICTREIEMTMNFMDSSDDECLQFFTIGQKYRLHSFLSPGAPRAKLLKTKTDCSTENVQDSTIASYRTSRLNVTQSFDNSSLTIYPNPAEEHIQMSLNFLGIDNLNIRISNHLGREMVVLKNVNPIGEILVNMDEWNTGIYFVSVMDKDEKLLLTPKRVVVIR